MIVMGDEVRRTQRGNNNAYCQANELSWFDWSLVQKHADVHRFVMLLLARRLLRDEAHEQQRVDLRTFLAAAKKEWHGVRLNEPDWGDDSHPIALRAQLPREGTQFYLILNAYWEPLEFELPPLDTTDGPTSWRRWIDTALDSPDDIVAWRSAPMHAGTRYRAEARSVVMLFANSR